MSPHQHRRPLIFDRNVNYGGHASIPIANAAFTRMGERTGAFDTEISSDPAVFQRESLRRFDAVFFNNNVGNLFEDAALRQSLVDFVYGGGGMMGVHGTTVAFTKWPGAIEDWPEFGLMIGARGANHNGTLLHHVDDLRQVKELYHAVPNDARLAGMFGGIFVGEHGWLTSMSTGGLIEGGPPEVFERLKLKSREVTIGANNHHANWFECLRSRAQPSAHAEIGHRSASLGHLAIIAYRLERSLKWDPVREGFIGNEEADRLRGRALREPWRV